MSIQAISWVLDSSKSRLGARLVMISIANYADKSGRNAFPSVRTPAYKSNLSAPEVQRSLREPVALGELRIDRGAGPKGTHLYSLPQVTTCRPSQLEWDDIRSNKGVTSSTSRGDNTSSEPSLTVQEQTKIKIPPAPFSKKGVTRTAQIQAPVTRRDLRNISKEMDRIYEVHLVLEGP